MPRYILWYYMWAFIPRRAWDELLLRRLDEFSQHVNFGLQYLNQHIRAASSVHHGNQHARDSDDLKTLG